MELHYAIENNLVSTVNSILENNDSVIKNTKNTKNTKSIRDVREERKTNGDTPAITAAKSKNFPLLKLLSNYGAPMNCTNSLNQDVLSILTNDYYIEEKTILFLLHCGCRPDPMRHLNLWHYILRYCRKGTVQEVLTIQPCMVDVLDSVRVVLVSRRPQILELLLRHGADPHQTASNGLRSHTTSTSPACQNLLCQFENAVWIYSVGRKKVSFIPTSKSLSIVEYFITHLNPDLLVELSFYL